MALFWEVSPLTLIVEIFSPLPDISNSDGIDEEDLHRNAEQGEMILPQQLPGVDNERRSLKK